MTGYEDPNFVKALKLMHSSAPDSTHQLMKLVEDAIEQKYGPSKVSSLKLRKWLDEPVTILDVPKARGSRGPSPVLFGTSEKTSRSSTPPSDPVSNRTSPERDDGDLALEIFEEDLFCTVCKDIRVTSENQLLECIGCRSLYHQECHKPPVEHSDNLMTNWKCSDCTKKQNEKAPVKAKISGSGSEKESSSKKQKGDSEKSESKSSKRGEKSSHGKSHSSSSSKHSSSGSSKSESRSSKSSSSLSFSKPPGSPNGKSGSAPAPANIMAADRRLQNMKKKAAAKMHEKRSSHK